MPAIKWHLNESYMMCEIEEVLGDKLDDPSKELAESIHNLFYEVEFDVEIDGDECFIIAVNGKEVVQ